MTRKSIATALIAFFLFAAGPSTAAAESASGLICGDLFRHGSTAAPVALRSDSRTKPSLPGSNPNLEKPTKFLAARLVYDALKGLVAFEYRKIAHKLGGPEVRIKDLSEQPTTPEEARVHELIARQVNKKRIGPFIRGLAEKLKKAPIIKDKIASYPEGTLEFAVAAATDSINAMSEFRGLTENSKHIRFVETSKYSENVGTALATQESLREEAIPNKLSDPRYMEELLKFGKTEFVDAAAFKILVNGPASFGKRDELFKNAKKSIDVASWAVLDDMTGFAFADKMIAKVREGVEVRLLIDGTVSNRKGYGEAVAKMEKGGVKVIRWYHPSELFQGQHRKFVIVDGTHMVAGGMNPGDTYSHLNPEASPWRDTDAYVAGNAVNAFNQLFARLWNEQIKWFGLKQEPAVPLAANAVESQEAPYRTALIESPIDSSKPFGTTILLTMMKAIRGAEKTIDIENAYVILYPVMLKEIEAAVKRGVRVRVLTNSDKSVDEPSIAMPIMRSAQMLASAGVEVYLRKGSTLHSKVMSVDGRVTFIKSYNIHPRSERIEGEMAVLTEDERVGKDFTAMFENDIRPEVATRVSSPSQIKIPQNIMSFILMRLAFDQL